MEKNIMDDAAWAGFYRKLQDNDDVIKQWLAQGQTYAWMKDEYKRLTGIDTTPSFWGMCRRYFKARMERDGY